MFARSSYLRYSFLAKACAALVLVLVADILFFDRGGGSTIGAFAFVWALLLAWTRPAIRRHRHALAALFAALVFALIMADDPSLLGWTLFWIALSVAALLPRFSGFDIASLWAVRLFLHALTAPFSMLIDGAKLVRLRRTRKTNSCSRILPVLILPLGGGALFLALFYAANPLISNALDSLQFRGPSLMTIFRIFFWGAVITAVWPMFRPRRIVTGLSFPFSFEADPLPGISVTSVTLSLLLFNLIFAVQNGLDILFLWSGAPLPQGVTLAEYAHRGAYPLIVTALLAGLFVLVTLRPGSETAERPLIRRLVVLWVTQNIFLVASSILRTLDYIAVFSLTVLRIAALAWMVLVAIGLALICWRMLRGRSAAWLINTSTACAAAMLTLASIIDLGAVAAAWNVRHASEAGGHGENLDLCYLNGLGSSALVPLARLEKRPLSPEFRDRVVYVRGLVLADLQYRQSEWGSWTFRGARRLNAAQSILGRTPSRDLIGLSRDCHGRVQATIRPPNLEPVEPPPTPAPLTEEPRR